MTVRRPPKLVKAGAKAKKQQTAKPAGNKARIAAGRKDTLATTPTKYGKLSPDYKKKAGDPGWLRSYSEEQIGLSGGRARMFEIVEAKKRLAAGGSLAKSPGGSTGKVAPWENLDAPTGTLMLGKPEKEEGAGGKGKPKKSKKSKGKGGRSKGGRKGQAVKYNKRKK